MSDDTPTSFDALACELNLSPRWRDTARLFFKLGRKIEREQWEHGSANPMSDSDVTPLDKR